MVVIGGMRSMLGPALGALFFILFRELFSIWTAELAAVVRPGLRRLRAVFAERPGRHLGDAATRWRPPPEEAAAMSKRKIYEGLPLPAFLLPARARRHRARGAAASRRHFGGIRAVTRCQPAGRRRRDPRADRAERRRQDHAVQPGLRPLPDRQRHHRLQRPRDPGRAVRGDLPAGAGALVPDHQPVQGAVDLRKPAPVAAGAGTPGASTSGATSTAISEVHAETAELIKFLGLEGIETIEGGELSYGGQRLVDLGIALGSKPQVLLLDEPLAGLAAAERERVSNLVKNIAANIPVLIVEHDIDRVLGFSQRVTVMNQGEVLMTGTPEAGARRPPRAGDLYRHRHARGRPARRSGRSAQAPRRCCASSASTPSTARATSCTTPRSTCARARSWRCSAATAPASRRC